MEQVSVNISKEELQEVINAYNIIQNFLVKMINKEEIYTQGFLKDINIAVEDIENLNIKEVSSYDEFIA